MTPLREPDARRRRTRTLIGPLVVATAVVLLPPPAAAATTAVRFAFDGAPSPDGTPISTATNHGSAPVQVSVRTRDGGRVVSASTRPRSSGRAIRFPRFDATLPSPRAVLAVVNASSTDRLDPGTGAIQFGADFVLDSASARAGTVDDGNNLMQRGLWDGRTQLKLEVDGGRLICRVKGRSGEVSITGSTTVATGRWYRASCRRSGSRVTLTLGSWSTTGAYSSRSWSKDGPTGSLTPASRSIPLSIGGKLNDDGSVHGATDQFNGLVDNVVWILG
ncbi:LamG domain-containing protein [Aquihabitans daechungensis]|uniref:LamG domain-containing protein n=1 Tax=Aquihabitans daechungensis TaxID=1052257 RepID=UPI003BA2FC13